MGQYNPHAPYILGQEWVPILNSHYFPDGVVERGYEFTLSTTTTPVSGAFYVNETPQTRGENSCDFISVYPATRETLSGPVQKLTIPASGVSVTNPGSIDITNGVAALLNPTDSSYILFDAGTGILSLLNINFDVSTYAALLINKRILDVRLLYSFISDNVANGGSVGLRLTHSSSGEFVTFPQFLEMTPTTSPARVSRQSITEINPMWDLSAVAGGYNQNIVLPWRFQELNRMRVGAPAAEITTLTLSNAIIGDTGAFLNYAALEVIFCEETRSLYGGFSTHPDEVLYNVGAIATKLYNPATFTQSNSLTPGNYVVTVYHRDLSAQSTLQSVPKIHAVRQYYELPNQRGIDLRQTLTVDDEFTSESSDVLTHVTLHTATSIVTGVHAYGTQFGAPVYGSRTVIQEIEDNPSVGPTPYPQVRFYARRYGNTTVPLTLVDVATGLSTVSITPDTFDALPEIVNGWREVTLRFATPPTFPVTADDVDWRWEATNELTGNQWQVMVASGPTGAWSAAAATGPATYWAPLGSTVGLTWQSPTISGAAFDSTSDAVLIFSQDPPAVTGFALTNGALPVTTALHCSSPPACVPTGIAYNRMTWTSFGVCDEFNRTTVNGWGTADTGQVWTTAGGVAADYATSGGTATVSISAVGSTRQLLMTSVTGDKRFHIKFKTDVQALGAYMGVAIMMRRADANNYLFAEMRMFPNRSTDLALVSRVGGTETELAAKNSGVSHIAGEYYHLVAEVNGNFMFGKIWREGTEEPDHWLLTAAATSITTNNPFGIRNVLAGGNTNVLPVIVTYDSVTVTPIELAGGTIEIERRDSLTDWQTVMTTEDPVCITGFNDYEARVGVLSEYRIRTLNPLDFAGPWVSGAAMIPSPGVQGAGDANSVLIFTSNSDTDASLAYVMQFSDQPVEEFFFPEADTVSLQRLFGRDYVLATRPEERGGERFTRTLLVNAAAISLPSLANFTERRDLAWADLDYICVRDELGNRWFATVIVPQGGVRGDRTIYLARIEVIKTTDTASPAEL
jgi:hypothetical protein